MNIVVLGQFQINISLANIIKIIVYSLTIKNLKKNQS